MTAPVSGLVLAAGASRRFGRPKQLLAWRDTTLLEWVIRQVVEARSLDEVVVVLGGAAAEVRARVDFGRARALVAEGAEDGCGASYRAGIAALDPRAAAVAVTLGDQPGVDAAIVDRMVTAWRSDPQAILAASYRGRIGHPMVFARELFPVLSALSGDKSAWKMIDARRGEVALVELDHEYPQDINTPDDYARLAGASTHA
jgi:molybdenum cofactor cytidylyltransferase